MECGDAGDDEEGNKDEGKLIIDVSDHEQLTFTLSEYLKYYYLPKGVIAALTTSV